MAKLFLTDYASYNNGTQFEFGHWVDLEQFSDADEFMEYIGNHFKEADEKSPLPCGSKREEIMFTDYEDFPESMYSECMSYKEMETLFEYLNLDGDDKAKYVFLIEQGFSHSDAISKYEDVYLIDYPDSTREKDYLFSEFYPEASKAEETCDYLEINYDRFINDCFIEFEYDGNLYLVLEGSY